jgi:hypothetical protein
MDRDRVGGRRRGAAVDRPGRRSVEDVILGPAGTLTALRRLAEKAVPA